MFLYWTSLIKFLAELVMYSILGIYASIPWHIHICLHQIWSQWMFGCRLENENTYHMTDRYSDLVNNCLGPNLLLFYILQGMFRLLYNICHLQFYNFVPYRNTLMYIFPVTYKQNSLFSYNMKIYICRVHRSGNLLLPNCFLCAKIVDIPKLWGTHFGGHIHLLHPGTLNEVANYCNYRPYTYCFCREVVFNLCYLYLFPHTFVQHDLQSFDIRVK